MKKIRYIIASALVSIGLCACTDTWDSHYSKWETVIDNTEIQAVDEPAADFLKTAQDYRKMYELFDKTGVIKTWQEKNLMYTIMVVGNESTANANQPVTKAEGSEGQATAEEIFKAEAHITDALLSPSNLEDGQRLLMWNGKYVTVRIYDEPVDGMEPGIYFNGSKVKKVIKTNNAYIYDLEDYINTPKALMEYLKDLPDEEYSIFKEMVLSRTQRVFDKAASTPIGIDKTGNTVYDSVFTEKSQYFADKKLDLYSENITATLLVPSNDLIENALKEAKEKLKSWNMEREDSILNNWIFQTAFFSKKYVKQDFIYNESDPASTQDFYSVFDQQWRTTVNKVDLDNPVELSNGVAYKITSLKIPTNKILIWRIKERFETFDQLTDEDKKYYYPGYNYISTYLKDIGENVQMNRVKQYVGANQPKPWLPAVYCKSMMLWVVDTDRPGIFKFKCYRLVEDKASTTGFTAVPYKIPAGPYNFYMGFNGSRSQVNATFYLNGKKIPKCESGPIPSSTMKGSNHDRSGGGYSELYKDSRYDRDGSTDLGVVIFDKTEELEVTIEFTKGAKSDMEPTTWCFRPTVDLY